MMQKLVILGLVMVLVAAFVPGPAAARQGEYVTVPIWFGAGDAWREYSIAPGDTVTLYYYWFARTEDQVQDFIDTAYFEITLDGEPVFNSQTEVKAGWGPIETYTYCERDVKRARWYFNLPPLVAGEHTLHTVITILTDVDDGVEAEPFQAGIIHNTTNILMVSTESVPAVVEPAPAAPNPAAPAPAAPAPVVVQTVVVEPAPPPSPSVPERIISEPAVGTFVAPSEAYWRPEPGQLVDPPMQFQPGTTLWVFGVDSTRHYYKVLLDAAYIWVRVETMGPTADEYWANTPLPNVVVQ